MTRRFWILWSVGVMVLLPARAPAPSIDASHTNGGLFSLTNHTSITGNFTNFATGVTQLNGWELNAGGLNGTRNFGTIIVGVGTFLNSSGPLRNIGGTITMAGGHIRGGLFTNGGYFSGHGTFLSPVQNHQWFIVSGGSVTFGSTFQNFGTFIIGSNQVNYLSAWSNTQTLTLAGGTICGAPLTLVGALEGFGTICAPLTITASGVVSATGSGFNFLELVEMRGGTIAGTTARNFGSLLGRGTIAAELVTFASTTITASGGSLTVSNLSSALNLGAMRVNSSASLVVFGAWTNDSAARLDMNGGTLEGGTFTVNGTVSGFGAFNVGVNVSAVKLITATSGTLKFHQAVSLTGGVLDASSGGVLKNFSVITGFGTVTTTTGVGQFENVGTVTLTGGMTLGSAPTQLGTFEVGSYRLTVVESWTNGGWLSVVGGTVTTVTQFNNDGQLRAAGRIESRLDNAGSVQLTGNSTVTDVFTNRGSFAANGFTLRGASGNNATASFAGGGTFVVGAGTASFDGGFSNHRGGIVTLSGGGLTSASSLSNEGFAGDPPFISGFGLVRGDTGIVNEAHATLTATGGVLRVQSATGSLSNSGAINIASNGRLDVAQPWTQFQTGAVVPSLNLNGGSVSGATLTMGGGGTTSGGNLTGFGTLFAAVDIGGNRVTASGGTLNFGNGTQATTLNGGTIAGTLVRNFGSLIANGVISAAFENRIGARLQTSGALLLSSATTTRNFGTILVGAHRLDVAANWTNSAFVTIAGGSVRTGGGTGLFSNTHVVSAGSSLDSHFANFGVFTLTDDTSVTGNFTNAGRTQPSGFDLSLRANFANEGDGIGSGVMEGAGTITMAPTSDNATFSNTVTSAENLGGNYDTRALSFTTQSGTLNVEVTSTDIGRSWSATPANGFSVGTLTLPNTLTLLRLLDDSVNQGGGTQEAIYVENLHLGSALTASNFDFGASSLKIYYNHIVGDSGVNFVGAYDGAARVIYFGNIQPLEVPVVVPEPNTLALLLLGVPVLWVAWRRRRSARKVQGGTP